jgi:hypothetical protein
MHLCGHCVAQPFFSHASTDNLTEKDKNIQDTHQRFWNEIALRRFDFDHDEKKAAEVGKITLESLRKFWDKYLDINSSERRKMSFQYSSLAHKIPERVERDTADNVAKANEKLVLKAVEKPADAAVSPVAASSEPAAAAAAPAAPAEVVYLPPVPVDPRPHVHIDDFESFKRGLMLFPAAL